MSNTPLRPLFLYDTEIIRGVLKDGEERLEGIEYCDGWGDHANMGVSVIGGYDYATARFRVFMADNFDDFVKLAGERTMIGFNSVRFDDRVCKANGLEVETHYDLLDELKQGIPHGSTWKGLSLDNLSKINFGASKTGHGALAPVLWQQGKVAQVVDYCLEDVRLLKLLIDRVLNLGFVLDPREGFEDGIIRVQTPVTAAIQI